MEKKIMTKEEFMEMAANPPRLQGPTVFRLREISTILELYRGKKRYPKYDVFVDRNQLYYTLDQAEAAMRSMVADDGIEGVETLAFIIEELPVNVNEFADAGSDTLSWRLYESDGTLIDQSTCCDNIHFSDTVYGSFLGRTPETIRFKRGDIVEVLDTVHGTISLAVVLATPEGPDVTWERFNECQNDPKLKDEDFWGDYFLDITDDTYVVCDGPNYRYHQHVIPRDLLKPHFKVPERTAERFRKIYQKLEAEL